MGLCSFAATATVHRGIINGNLGYFLPKDAGGTRVFQLEILGEKGNQRDAQVLFRINLSLQAKGGIHWQRERTIPSQPRLLTSGLLFPELFHLE